MLVRSGLAISFLIFSCLCGQGIAKDGCYDTNWQNLRYTAPSSDIGTDEVYVEALISHGSNIVLHVSSGDFISGNESKGLESTTEGRTWRKWRGFGVANAHLGASSISGSNSIAYKSVNGELFRSQDSGKTWNQLDIRIDGKSKEDFAFAKFAETALQMTAIFAGIDPKDPNLVYASFIFSPRVTSPAKSSYVVPGLYATRDGGQTWKMFTDRLSTSKKYISGLPLLGISQKNKNIMFGASSLGLVKSSDGGMSWLPVKQQFQLQAPVLLNTPSGSSKATPASFADPALDWRRLEVDQIIFQPGSDQVAYIVTNKGIFITQDGGDNWALLRVGTSILGSVQSIAINPVNSNQLFVGTSQGLFSSQDRGCHFTQILRSNQVSN